MRTDGWAAMPARSPIERIVTASQAMLKVCRDVEKLAGTHVPVLLLGESGTGKEALAQALHELGPRAKRPFVAINCGAIPENLLETELFGYERGAFTGAVKQTIGKIESANHGTLFLDEIADLPHPLQAKLLRFLQDQIIERIGDASASRSMYGSCRRPMPAWKNGSAGTFRGDVLPDERGHSPHSAAARTGGERRSWPTFPGTVQSRVRPQHSRFHRARNDGTLKHAWPATCASWKIE